MQGLQVRYTVFIVAVAIFLTAVLGYKIYEATRATSKAFEMTSGIMDPVFTAELEDKFPRQRPHRAVGIVGFGVLWCCRSSPRASGSPTRWRGRSTT
jgi:hypothetical protein